MDKFRKNKSLGQHFLKDEHRAFEIVNALQPIDAADTILEIGPGAGILTRFLIELKGKHIFISEIDERIIQYMKTEMKFDDDKIIAGDFLKANIKQYIVGKFMVIGNFPYNISSQILFKVIDYKESVPVLVGMFQKEMAKRVTARHGNKDYGVLSVLVQAYFHTEYLFELSPIEFDPPPKVFSAIIRITKKKDDLNCDEKLFKQIVKAAFNQRRKKLTNALSSFALAKEKLLAINFAHKRAEELSVEDFVLLTQTFSRP